MRPRVLIITALLGSLILSTGAASARVRLVTLPERDQIYLNLEHPDYNLVEEERTLTLRPGVNEIDFAWQGVSIDPETIILQPLDHPGEVVLLDVSYPPNENALIWTVYAPRAMEEKIRIAYLLNGIEREVSYRAVANTEETHMEWEARLKLINRSGEDLENVIVTTGYSADYTTTLEAGEARQTVIWQRDRLPFERTFTFDAALLPHDPSRADGNVGIPIDYVLQNDAASGLGRFPILYGKARLFQAEHSGGNAFLGEDWAQFTPVGEELGLFVGESRDIVVTRRVLTDERKNIRRNDNNRVVLYDQVQEVQYYVENFRDKDSTITLLDHFSDSWEIKNASHDWERVDATTIEFNIPVNSTGQDTVTFTVVRSNLQR